MRINHLEYYSIIAAIPREWKVILNNFNSVITHPIAEEGPMLGINKQNIFMKKVKCRNLYRYFIEQKFVRPTSEAKWVGKHSYNFSDEMWQHIYTVS